MSVEKLEELKKEIKELEKIQWEFFKELFELWLDIYSTLTGADTPTLIDPFGGNSNGGEDAHKPDGYV